MHYKKLIGLFAVTVLAGCAHQPTPYHVIESLVYKKGYMDGFYKEGITEEVIKPNTAYKLTAKLDAGSTKSRAQDMVLLHAAKLALASGHSKFSVNRMQTSLGCSNTSSKNGEYSITKNAWPMAYAFVHLLPLSNSDGRIRGKKYDAREVLQAYEQPVIDGPDPKQIPINKEENMLQCQQRR